MRNLLILTALFCCTLFSKEHSFKDFTEGNYFAPIDENYLQLKAVCRKNYDNKDRKKYYEVLFYSHDKHVFDLNKHFIGTQPGHRNLKKPFYSFTLWNWFNAVAVKTKSEEFISNTAQLDKRRSEIIPRDLVKDILDDGRFTVYFHYLMDNSKSVGTFKVSNPELLRTCFE
jgi:hypothetical protein